MVLEIKHYKMNDKQKLESLLSQLLDLRLGKITQSIIIDKGEFATLLEDCVNLKIAEYNMIEEKEEHDKEIEDMMQASTIIHAFNEGATVEEIAQETGLSEDHTQDIIDTCKQERGSKMQVEEDEQREPIEPTEESGL